MGEIIFCNECKWYKHGECNLYPPSVLDVGVGGDIAWLRKVVAPDDFCSMAEKKEISCHINKKVMDNSKTMGHVSREYIVVHSCGHKTAICSNLFYPQLAGKEMKVDSLCFCCDQTLAKQNEEQEIKDDAK